MRARGTHFRLFVTESRRYSPHSLQSALQALMCFSIMATMLLASFSFSRATVVNSSILSESFVVRYLSSSANLSMTLVVWFLAALVAMVEVSVPLPPRGGPSRLLPARSLKDFEKNASQVRKCLCR